MTLAPLGRFGRDSWFQGLRSGFRAWRRTRPFWGGLWCILGGVIIAYGPTTAIKIILISGTIVWLGIMVGLLVVLMGLFLWFAPHLRQLVGVMAVAFSMVSLITSDYGGFFIGLLLGTIGGALGFAWTPIRPKKT
jgi:Family of unknown function (DUF6114)